MLLYIKIHNKTIGGGKSHSLLLHGKTTMYRARRQKEMKDREKEKGDNKTRTVKQ